MRVVARVTIEVETDEAASVEEFEDAVHDFFDGMEPEGWCKGLAQVKVLWDSKTAAIVKASADRLYGAGR